VTVKLVFVKAKTT